MFQVFTDLDFQILQFGFPCIFNGIYFAVKYSFFGLINPEPTWKWFLLVFGVPVYSNYFVRLKQSVCLLDLSWEQNKVGRIRRGGCPLRCSTCQEIHVAGEALTTREK